MIERILPRKRVIARKSPAPGIDYQQVIIANPDQVLFVFACAYPAPRHRMLDRFLVIAEWQRVQAIIVANKVDLVDEQVAQELFLRYQAIGYTVLFTSAKTGSGLEALRAQLVGKISALTGPSGAGKSSLLNAIQPGLGLEVSRVSASTGKGQHTTVASEMFPLEGGGYVADTPGLKAVALWDIEPEELDGYFPEISPLVAGCQFSNCTHIHEPGCAVKAAVEDGRVHPDRFDSYLRIREGEDMI